MWGSLWFHLVYKSFIPHISYTRMHCGVPTASFTPFRTSEAPPVYQPCPPSLSVPPRDPSPVPNTFRSAVRTPEAHLLYRIRFGVRFVPQRPISCTEYVLECGSYPRGPYPVPNTFRVRFVPQRPISCTELCWESFRASESLILCRVHHNKCTMWLLAYGKMALLMSIRVAEKQKSESGAI